MSKILDATLVIAALRMAIGIEALKLYTPLIAVLSSPARLRQV